MLEIIAILKMVFFLYGFVTIGEDWEMLRYDGTSFSVAEELVALFGGMERKK